MSRASPLQSDTQPAGPLSVVIVGSPAVAAEASRVADMIAHRGHTVVTVGQDDSGSDQPAPGGGPLAEADLIVVLGGDGSILRTARWMGYTQVPTLGINLGRLGFLADTLRADAAAAIAELEAGRFRLVSHMMFECEVVRRKQVIHHELGLNETAVLAGPPFTMIEIELLVDGEPATTYRADGLIISTPVGSTAYNLSAGGPIVRKDLDAFVFTPLNPHTLTNRTVVDSAARRYELQVARPNAGSACMVDGRVVASLAPGDAIRVWQAKPRFTLVEVGGHGYYRTLREKLAWGGLLRAADPTPPESSQ